MNLAASLCFPPFRMGGPTQEGHPDGQSQVSMVVTVQFIVLFFVPMALLAFLSWSVGESLCRERWGAKLAAFEGQFRWRSVSRR